MFQDVNEIQIQMSQVNIIWITAVITIKPVLVLSLTADIYHCVTSKDFEKTHYVQLCGNVSFCHFMNYVLQFRIFYCCFSVFRLGLATHTHTHTLNLPLCLVSFVVDKGVWHQLHYQKTPTCTIRRHFKVVAYFVYKSISMCTAYCKHNILNVEQSVALSHQSNFRCWVYFYAALLISSEWGSCTREKEWEREWERLR